MIFFEILVWNSICCWSPSNCVMKNQWHFTTLQFIPFSGSHFPWPNCYLSAQPSLALTNTPSGDACALMGAWVWAHTTFFFHPAKVLNRSLASKRALWLLSSFYSVPPSAGSGSTHTLQHLMEWPPWPGEALVGHGSPERHSPSPLAQPPQGYQLWTGSWSPWWLLDRCHSGTLRFSGSLSPAICRWLLQSSESTGSRTAWSSYPSRLIRCGVCWGGRGSAGVIHPVNERCLTRVCFNGSVTTG